MLVCGHCLACGVLVIADFLVMCGDFMVGDGGCCHLVEGGRSGVMVCGCLAVGVVWGWVVLLQWLGWWWCFGGC
jgi:hypothetical protein